MGINATITVIPRIDVRKKQRPADLPRFELNREWSELDCALEKMGSPGCMALRGNQRASDDENIDCELILVPPALVKKICKALGTVSDGKLLEAIHEERKKTGWRLRKYEHKGWLAVFDALKAAYRLASRKDAYVEIFIG